MTTRIHKHLVEDRRDAIAILRIDREDRLGALSREMLEALDSYLEGLVVDPAVRVLVLTGTGRGFIAGADIGEYDGVSFDHFTHYQRLGRRVSERLARLPQPTIAAINGYALGGGLELALCCDLRLAADVAKMGLPEIKLGLVPGGSGTQRLSRILGASAALELLWSGRAIAANEAYRLGLLLRPPIADDVLARQVETLAEEIAASAPRAIRAAKSLVYGGLELPLAAAWTLEQAALGELFLSPDGQEGIRAFIEKRPPDFSNGGLA